MKLPTFSEADCFFSVRVFSGRNFVIENVCFSIWFYVGFIFKCERFKDSSSTEKIIFHQIAVDVIEIIITRKFRWKVLYFSSEKINNVDRYIIRNMFCKDFRSN